MDFDLERSLRLLEDSISRQGNLLITTTPKTKQRHSENLTPRSLIDVEKQRYSINDKSFNAIVDENKSIAGSVLRINEPWKLTVNSLFVEFYEVLQSYTNSKDVFDTFSDLARCCTDALQVIKSLKRKSSVHYIDEETWLENERNTWRLLLALCQDRFITLNNGDAEPTSYYGKSEKLCVANLFKNDSIVRETQLVIDWLEYNAAERDIEALHFSDISYGWENTLHQLKSADTIVYESSRQVVKSLHPDAQWSDEHLTLHDLDVEDDKRLSRMIFQQIRCGKMDKAQELCVNSGHSWRAAVLEGWRLYHDNTDAEMEAMEEENDPDSASKYCYSEGNEIRDKWKAAAYDYCKLEYLNLYEKASVAALCGSLNSILRVAENWEDYLWAYMKVLIDIRVESEIRDVITAQYESLPDEYWDQRVSLNDVFENLEDAQNTKVKNEAQLQMRIVQKFIILDDVPQMIDIINEWIENSNVATQFLRFASHMVLFLEQIGKIDDRDKSDNIIESYISRLAEMNDIRLIAFYSSKLGLYKRIFVYASYLERVLDNEQRKEALTYAEDCGMNVQCVAKQVVENIRNRPHEVSTFGNLQEKLTDTDLLKVSAIDWLLISDTTKLDAIEQTNALIFSFLTLRKLDAAQLAFNKIPPNIVDEILSEDELEPNINQILKEHLSYRAYLDAQEAFNEWYKQYKSKPIPPGELSENAHFTEKVAHQHRESQFRADTERWKLSTAHLSKTAKAKLYNVLLFPEGGWLSSAKDCAFLRSTCIPEIVLLLYSVLSESGYYEECLQLADTVASEKYGLYKAFSKDKLKEFLKQLCDSSVILLNKKKDAWGTIVKKENKFSRCRDPFLKEGLNAIVEVHFTHSHRVSMAEAYSYLRISSSTKDQFLKYFSEGLNPSEAKRYHTSTLMATASGDKICETLANAQVNPMERSIYHLYEQWRFQANVCNKLPMKTKDIEDLEDPKKIKDCDTKKLQAIALYSSTTKMYEVILVGVQRRFQ
ncbi:hypothetical protein RN001_011711 [Aquatica leii]|uniref:Nuclear pore complex protein n=1 Tax=Aquatica leii TaxID=1421715 RepID=A0AAN7P1X8_9COLE|nr:hypothetical protein RN001_011711 [Aquatica leii]